MHERRQKREQRNGREDHRQIGEFLSAERTVQTLDLNHER